MKFGGTSVGDASCILRASAIVAEASSRGPLIVVVSAMSGVTDRLIEAAACSEAGDIDGAIELIDGLREQHFQAAKDLIEDLDARRLIELGIEERLREARRLCEGIAMAHELAARTLDSLSSLGERLCAPLVAGALEERGLRSEAVEATELIVTDSYHGAAEPLIELTQARCEARLRPLLQQGIVPVVTGFIGATADNVLTTLGRGGSDYSATILGGVLCADEVTIWTDVNGILTADPRLVAEAQTIPEISCREAAELARLGAKVLHPKTLSPVTQAGIPVWIRNTFEAEHPGTKITPHGVASSEGVKTVTAIREVSLIGVGGPRIAGLNDLAGRTLSATTEVRANVLFISQSSSQNDICLVVYSSDAKRTVEALRREFAHELAHQKITHITLDPNVALVAVIGENLGGIAGLAEDIFDTVGREKIIVMTTAQDSSQSNVSIVVASQDMEKALRILHRELVLDGRDSQGRMTASK